MSLFDFLEIFTVYIQVFLQREIRTIYYLDTQKPSKKRDNESNVLLS